MSSMMDEIGQPEKQEGGGSKAQQARVTWVLVAILGLALGLRVGGIGYGLPYQLFSDEVHEIIRAVKLGVGEYSWIFGKGGLYYILFVEYGLLYVVWWLLGWVGSPREFAVLFVQDPSIFFLAGRLTVALMGTLTCLVMFLIGKRVYDWRVGLGAAFIGATAYLDGIMSQRINVDTGMTLALWASILAYLEYENKGDRRWLIASGVLAGVAIAFKVPGAIVLLPLLLAIGSRPARWLDFRQMFKEAGILLLTTLVTLTVVAPEWIVVGSHYERFSSAIVGHEEAFSDPDEEDDIYGSPHVFPGTRDWGRYVRMLTYDHNIALFLTALLGVGFGLFRRRRWDIICTVFIGTFLVIMSAATRGQERYLLPIMPALWLLSSYAIVTVSGHRSRLTVAGLACVVVLPLVALVRNNHESTKSDTRVLAKEWIEETIPAGSKILMDGTRYRFIGSPPLTPDTSSITRQATKAIRYDVSRGVSARTLELYIEANKTIKGPRYELHSTAWGFALEDPTYYVEACFDYIITSSRITERYGTEIGRKRFPQSALFYEQLDTDPRFQLVYSVAPIPWKRPGPTIKVYKVVPPCGRTSAHLTLDSHH